MVTILCYGDSNTYGYNPADGMRYPEEIRWPCLLRDMLCAEPGAAGSTAAVRGTSGSTDAEPGVAAGTAADRRTVGGTAPGHTAAQVRIIEEGCNGRTASCTPEDEPWKDGRPYLPACLNSHKPLDLVILMLGSNDLKKQFHASPESITAGVREHLQTIADFMPLKQGYCPRVLLLSPPWIGEGIAQSAFSDSFCEDAISRSQRLAALYEQTASDFTASGLLECDYLDAAKICQPSKIDSLHLDPEAHAALARAIAGRIRQTGICG